MGFYKQQHEFYGGVDLQAKTMHLCLVDQVGEILLPQNLPTDPDRILNALAEYRNRDLIIGVEAI